MQKLYVIVRSDLAPGAQLAQSGHAVAEFALAHPEVFKDWAGNQRNIVCLNARDEHELIGLLDRAADDGVLLAFFREPDFSDEITAIALGAGAEKLTSSLPLALKTPKKQAA